MEFDLVSLAGRGDQDAFATLYQRHLPRVLALALRLVADEARAEELTQDTFVAAWRALPRFRGDAQFSTWLHAIAVRTCFEELRRRSRRPEFLSLNRLESYLSAALRAMPETRLDVERAIATLPMGARTVLVLYCIEGLNHHEIGALLGISTGTVKSQLHRARQLLRERLHR